MKKNCPTCPDSYLALKDWHAIHNAMPPGPHTLYVVGTVTVPTAGYTVSLTEAASPGINPKILILDLNVKKPSGPAAEVVSDVDVRWDHNGAYDGGYDEVHVRCGVEVVLELDIQLVV